MALIVPRASRVKFLLEECAVERQGDITRLLEEYLRHDGQYTDENASLDMIDLCSMVVSRSTWGSYYDEFTKSNVSVVLKAVIKLHDNRLLNPSLHLFFRNVECYQLLEAEILRLGEDWLHAM